MVGKPPNLWRPHFATVTPEARKRATPMHATGLLIVGHGTREPEGVEAFGQVVEDVRKRVGVPVEGCFLEFAHPTIGEGVRRMAAQGVRRIVAMPLLLFAAGHVRRDIPAALAAAASVHPGIQVVQTLHLGCCEAIVELSRRRCEEALTGLEPVPAEATAVLLVGRGSREVSAREEMRRFAAVRGVACWPRGAWCFLAMGKPSLSEGLQDMAAGPARRIVVQPHLLFPGKLCEEVTLAVARQQAADGAKQWVVARPLGPDPLVSAAIIDRAAPWLAGVGPWAGSRPP